VAPVGYADLLEQVKVRVRTSRVQAANTELVGLYWQIGPLIIDRQESEGRGGGVLARWRDGCWRTTPSDLRSEINLNTALWFTYQCAT